MTDINKCSLCGLCKAHCPVYRVLLRETKGPRGKVILIKKDVLDKLFYDCTLCDSCKIECPAGINLDIRKMRERLVKKGIETEANKKMIKNMRKFGNPFGKLEKGKMPKELYCC